jgi:hypothetical protein
MPPNADRTNIPRPRSGSPFLFVRADEGLVGVLGPTVQTVVGACSTESMTPSPVPFRQRRRWPAAAPHVGANPAQHAVDLPCSMRRTCPAEALIQAPGKSRQKRCGPPWTGLCATGAAAVTTKWRDGVTT